MASSFICRKFNAMLGISTVTMSITYLVMLSGALIVGNLVGPAGLAGLNVCLPAFGAASFVSALLSVGSGLVFSQAMGAFDERRASGVFSQNALMALAFGVFIFAVMQLFGPAFFDFMGVTGEVRRQAEVYWQWESVAMGLNPMVCLLEVLVYADGDSAVATAASASHVAGSIGLSILFTKMMGTAGGVALGKAATMVLVLLVASLHFLRRNNHLKPVRYWSRGDLAATLTGSLPDASIYLCWALLIMVVNKVVVLHYDPRLLAVVSLAGSITEFSIVFDGVGEALIPLGGMYAGERNWPALQKLANHSALVATAEGLVCGILFFAFAPAIAPLYGIRGAAADLLPQAVWTTRALACAMPFMGFLMMANTHYLIVGHVAFAVSVTFLKDFILPCAMVFPCAWLWGFDGIWVGFALGYVLAAAYPFLFVRLRCERKMFPWLVPPTDRIGVFSARLTNVDVAKVRDRIEQWLVARAVPDLIVKRAMFAVEETGVASAERNARALVEYSVFLDQPGFLRMVTRDMGKTFDVNRVTPFLAAWAERRYLNTLSCNRSEYIFKIIGQKE